MILGRGSGIGGRRSRVVVVGVAYRCFDIVAINTNDMNNKFPIISPLHILLSAAAAAAVQ